MLLRRNWSRHDRVQADLVSHTFIENSQAIFG